MITPKNLLIVRTDRIGDVVLSLPLAELVKRHFPECKVTYLLREYTKCIAQNHPFIDNILLLNEENGRVSIINNIKELSKYNFDTCVIVYPTFQTVLITFLSRIKNRIGTGYRWYSFLLNNKIYEHRKYAEKHELEYNVGLLEAFGIDEKVNVDNIEFHLKVSEESKQKIDELLFQNNIDLQKPIIIIHPGSGGSAIDLPLNSFKELVEMILKNTDATIIITGLASEKELCNQLTFDNSIKNFAGILSLSDLIALIDNSSIVISNSTGPIHIAAAVKKRVIGFYPKILSCSAKRWGPYSNKAKIFVPEIDCSDCTREQCERLDCMSSIKMSKVFSEVKNLLNFN
jgi:lipopolysaccharide heptosyltransferase II